MSHDVVEDHVLLERAAVEGQVLEVERGTSNSTTGPAMAPAVA
jgi:hypothetical protein